MKSLDLFRSGLNTYEISQKLHKPEHEVSRAIYMARCNEKGLDIRTEPPLKLKKTKSVTKQFRSYKNDKTAIRSKPDYKLALPARDRNPVRRKGRGPSIDESYSFQGFEVRPIDPEYD